MSSGLYLITTECVNCGEKVTKYAIAQYSPLCGACNFAIEKEREFQRWLSSPPRFWPYTFDTF